MYADVMDPLLGRQTGYLKRDTGETKERHSFVLRKRVYVQYERTHFPTAVVFADRGEQEGLCG